MEIQLSAPKKLVSAIQSLNCVTKSLAFQCAKKGTDKRKLVVSTNFLELLGWTKGTRIAETVMGIGKGLRITKLALGEKDQKKVHERSYKRSSRTETLLDIRGQKNIAEAFMGAVRARIIITKAQIDILPVFNATAWAPKGATIRVPSLSEYDDAIIRVLNTLLDNKVTHCQLVAESEFWASHDAVILKLQLLRNGYDLEEVNGSLYLSNGQPAPDALQHIEVSQTISAQAPPMTNAQPEAFVGFSAGFDAHLLQKLGFNVTQGLEYAPPEKRHTSDKSEQYALPLAVNANLNTLYNENIFTADRADIGARSYQCDHAHYSLSCLEFSPLKNKTARLKAIQDLSTSRDMFVALLDLLRFQRPKTISVENVKQFKTSREAAIFRAGLEALGYRVEEHILKAPEFGGLTKRVRYYLFATCIESQAVFVAPTPLTEAEQTQNAWDSIKFDADNMRDVSHTKTLQIAVDSIWFRPFSEGDALAPTLTRSQLQQCKDAVYVGYRDRHYMPTIAQLRALASMPDSFEMDFCTKETQAQIVGHVVNGTKFCG